MAGEKELLEKALEDHRNGRFQQAAQGYNEVLRADAGNADALYLFGCLAQQTGNYATARDLIERALEVAPEQAEYHYALGLAFCSLQDSVAAARSYERAVELDPAVAKFWYGLGCAENLREEFVAARDCFAKAVAIQPDWLEARHNVGRALYETGRVSEAFSEFKHCAEMNADGSEQSLAMMAVIVPGVPEIDNAGILKTRHSWAERFNPRASEVRRISGKRPRRVGYVSSFFHRDNWMKPVWALINQHDREAVQVHLFSDCAPSEIQHGYSAKGTDRFMDTSGMANSEIAALVEECGIDLLVDLNGYSNMRRLPMFTQHPAPVVVGWFNMYATTGMRGFDYLIGDPVVVPAADEECYSEKILRVSGSYLTFDVSYPVPDVGLRGLDGPVVFGALASQYKITESVIETWCRILHESEGSVLLIKNKRLASEAMRRDLLARFAKWGVGAERLQLEGPESHFEFLRAYERIDVALDTFPYNGGTTTTEAIWQGVPVVTFYGDRWASRTSASILRAGGLAEFVASDLGSYEELAIRLGREVERVRELRRGMREKLKVSEVCNTVAFAREMEALYQRVLS